MLKPCSQDGITGHRRFALPKALIQLLLGCAHLQRVPITEGGDFSG